MLINEKDKKNNWIDEKKWSIINDVIKTFPYLNSKEAKEIIFENISWTLNHCAAPNIEENMKITNLVQGRVQSGKTTNFVSLAAGAFDQGYKIVITLAGTNSTLVNQNLDNVSKAFGVLRDNNVKIFVTDDINQNCTAFITENIKNNNNVFIVIMKHIKHIKSVASALKSNYNAKWPVLIIDDEADINTINLCVQKLSPLHGEIVNLQNIMPLTSYIEYTGTPQSLLLGSYNNSLSPVFGNTIRTSPQYCGLNFYHHSDSKYVETIESVDSVCSYCYSLYYFLFASYFAGKQEDLNYEMLVYSNYEINENKKLVQIYSTEIENIKNKKFKDEIINLLFSKYKNFVTKNGKKELETILSQQAYYVRISELFGKSTEKIKIKNNQKIFPLYIGSKLLGRGVSFRNLLVEYLSLENQIIKVDNLLQKARWFGYRTKNRNNWLKVFTTQKLKETFEDCRKADNAIWTQMRLIRHSESSLLDRAIYFPSAFNYLIPTETKKMTGSKKEILKKGEIISVEISNVWDESVQCLQTLIEYFVKSHDIPVTQDLLKLAMAISYLEGNASLNIKEKKASYVVKSDVIIYSRKTQDEI